MLSSPLKSMTYIHLIATWQLIMIASCQSDPVPSKSIASTQQTKKIRIVDNHEQKQVPSCCQSNLPDRFAVPSQRGIGQEHKVDASVKSSEN